MKKVLVLLTAAALIGGLVAFLTNPASADDEPSAEAVDHPRFDIFWFTKYDGASTSDSEVGTVLFGCRPNWGNHPDVKGTCDMLRDHDADFTRIDTYDNTMPGACTMEYRPVTVKVTGLWEGRSVEYTTTYGNECVANHAAAGIFTF